MQIKTMKKLVISCIVLVTISSCAKKLDIYPTNQLSDAQVYSTAAGYKSVLAKIYGTLAITGNQGPAGSPDIAGGLDEGSQVAFIRGFFNMEELPTDEAVEAWNDKGVLDEFHNLSWTPSNTFILGIYARPIYNITLINEYLRESTDDKLAARNITGSDATDIKRSRAEARFLRAFNYWVMLDLFGKSTFITETDGVGTYLPKEISRADLFKYIESELLAIDGDLAPVKTIEYGRVDQGAEWALLARLYLNAQVYTGTQRYTDAVTYANKVITQGGYTLHPKYAELFMADNNKCTDECIFSIPCDGLHTQAYGNTTFLAHCASGDDHNDFGVSGGWYGYRATSALGSLFPADNSGNLDTTKDDRAAAFYTTAFKATPSQMNIDAQSNFASGLHVKKFINVRSDGGPVSDITNTYVDVDFPVFRLPEMYLIYAEAVLRGGTGGDAGTALGYINDIRARANTTPLGNLTLQNILDERARELFWEGHRRTDLIRYGLLTNSTYLWPWKGGVSSGTAVNDKYNIYPIPQQNLTANPNLTQNKDYQ